ncbi:MAG: hypothetical protein O3C65_15290 [Proteobacteria bacterium]|nr:hypothetical protein [Pseudomonadota bacterium]
MRKGLIFGGGAVAVLFAVVVVVLLVALASVDSIVKAAIERVGSDVTKTTVSVDDVSISVRSGKGTISGLTIGHPEGFDERVMRIGQARIVLDIGSLTSDTIIIKEVIVTAPQVTVEVNRAGTNISRLQDTLSSASEGSAPSDGGDNPEDKKRLIIERITITDGRVDLKAAGLERGVGADLPPITLTDIGKDGGGAEPAEVTKVILAAVSAAASQAAIGSGVLQKLGGDAGNAAKSLLEKSTGRLRGILKQ